MKKNFVSAGRHGCVQIQAGSWGWGEWRNNLADTWEYVGVV